jgi:hypothetical protein
LSFDFYKMMELPPARPPGDPLRKCGTNLAVSTGETSWGGCIDRLGEGKEGVAHFGPFRRRDGEAKEMNRTAGILTHERGPTCENRKGKGRGGGVEETVRSGMALVARQPKAAVAMQNPAPAARWRPPLPPRSAGGSGRK